MDSAFGSLFLMSSLSWRYYPRRGRETHSKREASCHAVKNCKVHKHRLLRLTTLDSLMKNCHPPHKWRVWSRTKENNSSTTYLSWTYTHERTLYLKLILLPSLTDRDRSVRVFFFPVKQIGSVWRPESPRRWKQTHEDKTGKNKCTQKRLTHRPLGYCKEWQDWMNRKRRRNMTYETIATTLASLPVGNNDSLFNFTEDFKKVAKTLVRSVIRKSSYEDFRVCRVLVPRMLMSSRRIHGDFDDTKQLRWRAMDKLQRNGKGRREVLL